MTMTTRPETSPPHRIVAARRWARAHPLGIYFALAFGFAWSVEIVAFVVLDVPPVPAVIVAGFGPPLAAVIASSLTDGRPGVQVLKHRLFRWRVGLRWYAFALVAIPLVGFSSFLFLSDGTENLPRPPLVIASSYLLLVLIMMFLGGGQEELGWRGYALDPLQLRFGPLRANLLLGVVWGLWHLPLYLLISDYNNAGSTARSITTAFLGFVGYTVVLSMLLAWAYNSTRGSVFLAMLLHGSMNALFAFAPATATASWCLTGAVGVLALLALVATGGRLGHHVPPIARDSTA